MGGCSSAHNTCLISVSSGSFCSCDFHVSHMFSDHLTAWLSLYILECSCEQIICLVCLGEFVFKWLFLQVMGLHVALPFLDRTLACQVWFCFSPENNILVIRTWWSWAGTAYTLAGSRKSRVGKGPKSPTVCSVGWHLPPSPSLCLMSHFFRDLTSNPLPGFRVKAGAGCLTCY